MSLAGELLGNWAPIIRTVELRSGQHGRFEVSLDGELTFSKKALKRFPKSGEVASIVERSLGPTIKWRTS